MILYLRRARKICQLTSFDVKRMTGLELDTIRQAETTNENIDKQTTAILWDLYGRVPHPPSRFKGKLQTVEELKAVYYEDAPG